MKFRQLSILVGLFLFAGAIFLGCQSQEMTSAKLYIQQQNWDQAEEFLIAAEENEPENPEPPFLLGAEIYARQGNWEDMNAAFNRSLAISDQFSDQIENIRQRYWAEEFNAGAKAFNQAIEQEGEDQQKALKAAINNFENAVTIAPDRGETYGSLATAYLLLGDVDRAQNTFEEALEKNPDNFSVAFNYGKLLAEQGETERAQELLEKAYQLEPENSNVIQLLASLYVKAGNVEDAMEMFDAAIDAEPDNANLYFNKAILHIQLAQNYDEGSDDRLQQYQNALDAMNKALEINPDDLAAKERAGELYQQLEQWDEAVKIFEELVEEKPNDPVLLRKLAISVYRSGDAKRGQELLEKAKQMEQQQSQ